MPKQSNSFFSKMGLSSYYDQQPRAGHRTRQERADDSPSSSSDDDDEDNSIFDSVKSKGGLVWADLGARSLMQRRASFCIASLGIVFGGGQQQYQQQQYQQQQQEQGGLGGMISGLVDKVTGHGHQRADSGLAGMNVSAFDPDYARQQHSQIYGGGMLSGVVSFVFARCIRTETDRLSDQSNLGLDAIAAAAGYEAMRMFQSRGGNQQEPSLAKNTLTGLAVAEAGRLIKNYFREVGLIAQCDGSFDGILTRSCLDSEPSGSRQTSDEGNGGCDGCEDLARDVRPRLRRDVWSARLRAAAKLRSARLGLYTAGYERRGY